MGAFAPIFYVYNIYNKVTNKRKNMSTVTDRMDQNLITLAKQRYETQQKLAVPGYTVKLPSKGIIYPAASPLKAGTVELRHMTAYEEDILTNESYQDNGIVLEKLIESLLQTPGVTPNDFHPKDFEKLVIAARIYGYGPLYPVTIINPKSGQLLEREIDLTDIADKEFILEADENGEFEYIVNEKNVIKFKYLSKTELNQIDPEHRISGIVQKSICAINGNRDLNFIENYVKYELIARDSKKFREYMATNIFGMNFELQFEGESGDTFTSTFQLDSGVFWS